MNNGISSGTVNGNIERSVHFDFLEKLFIYVKNLPGNKEPDKDGIAVAIWYIKVPALICLIIGNPAKAKVTGRVRNACEKVTRILVNLLMTSFQMRNPRKKWWGGGIRNEKLIVSCSGFEDEYADEIYAFIYAVYHNYMEGGIFYKYKRGKATFEEVLICELKKFQPHSPKNKYITYILSKATAEVPFEM
jgi:hypothetical protein